MARFKVVFTTVGISAFIDASTFRLCGLLHGGHNRLICRIQDDEAVGQQFGWVCSEVNGLRQFRCNRWQMCGRWRQRFDECNRLRWYRRRFHRRFTFAANNVGRCTVYRGRRFANGIVCRCLTMRYRLLNIALRHFSAHFILDAAQQIHFGRWIHEACAIGQCAHNNAWPLLLLIVFAGECLIRAIAVRICWPWRWWHWDLRIGVIIRFGWRWSATTGIDTIKNIELVASA